MKVCILGNGLVSLTLANTLVNRGLNVDIIYAKKHKSYNQSRTLSISKSNVEYFNKNIVNIEKILWKIRNIKIYTENLKNNEIVNFTDPSKEVFSILKNDQLYKLLEKNLKNKKLFKYKKNLNYKNILKKNYNLIINCDINHEITKKFFSNMLKKDYNSFAYTTFIKHKKLFKNDTAIQIFTNDGPIAFLPISPVQTSIVCSLREKSKKTKININELIKRFNPKFKLISISEVAKFELSSSNLRKYYNKNILAFGDLLHRIHPLAGQGFNMCLRDIIQLTKLIDNKLELGIDIDKSICIEFQNKTKDKNYLFSKGIDLIYELFNIESKTNNKFLSKSFNYLIKNKLVKNFFKKFADTGISI